MSVGALALFAQSLSVAHLVVHSLPRGSAGPRGQTFVPSEFRRVKSGRDRKSPSNTWMMDMVSLPPGSWIVMPEIGSI